MILSTFSDRPPAREIRGTVMSSAAARAGGDVFGPSHVIECPGWVMAVSLLAGNLRLVLAPDRTGWFGDLKVHSRHFLSGEPDEAGALGLDARTPGV